MGSVNRHSALSFAVLIDKKAQIIKTICGASSSDFKVRWMSLELTEKWMTRNRNVKDDEVGI